MNTMTQETTQPIDINEAARLAQVSAEEIIERIKSQPGATVVMKLQVTRKATGKVENWTLVCKG